MKIINEDIKTGNFKNIYLLYGEEDYLKKQYKDRLKEAVVGEDTINYSYFEGDKVQAGDIIGIADTLPFFADHRLIIIENSKFFKNANDELASFIRNIPEYMVLVFVESEVDKRNKVYKAVSEKGYVCEMKQQTTAVLKKWITGMISKENKTIDNDAVELLLEKTGAGMDLIRGEIDKLVSYCIDKDNITAEDVSQVCTTQTVSRIFDMIAAIAQKRQREALNLYYDLLLMKEPPMRILYLLTRQFNGILQVKEGLSNGKTNAGIAADMGVAPFIVGKYVSQAKNFTSEQIIEALKDFADIEERTKLGKIEDKLGVELMIVKYSSKTGKTNK